MKKLANAHQLRRAGFEVPTNTADLGLTETKAQTSQRDTPRSETIAEKLDRQFPVTCLICETSMQRAGQDWPICLKCGLDQTGAEAYAIQRYKPQI